MPRSPNRAGARSHRAAGGQRPLYRAAVGNPRKLKADGHAGLWFDKFCNRWRIDNGTWTMSSRGKGANPKLQWIKTVTGRYIGNPEQIEECVFRLLQLIDRRGGRSAVFTTESRFVTGLGRSHPAENGFVWHPTLGTPCLPGSSVKGLVRSWAKAEALHRADSEAPHRADSEAAHHRDPETRETWERLFGTPEGRGSVCFLDAVPVAPVKLEADVMTPHFAGWSAGDPPGDWRSPTPIPLLTTAAETPFLAGFIPCGQVENGDLDILAGWLRSALEWAGAGAKTAVGYGRFRRDQERTDEWTRRLRRLRDELRRRRRERERREAAKTPEGRWRMEIEGRPESEILELVRIHLERDPLEDAEERTAFAKAVLETGFVESWYRGRKHSPQTLVGKKKLKQRARLVRRVLPGR